MTANVSNMSRSLPYVFTEQGVAMLATILKTKISSEVSIAIMRAFVTMRHFIIDNNNLYLSLNNIHNELSNHNQVLLNHDEKINQLFNKFECKESKESKEKIYFEGQIYEAYSKLNDILKEAKIELIIIDNYADKTLLDMISNLNVNVVIITKEKSLLKELDINKYNEQYHNLKVIYDNSFHDRFILIDKKVLYHCGASLKDLGKKCFAINKILDREIINSILVKINYN